MSLRNLILSLAYICVGVAIGVMAMQPAWFDWLYGNLHYLLAAIILGAMVLALTGALAYLVLKWWIKRKLDIEGDLTGEQVVIGLADKLTNRDAIDSPTAQERVNSLMVNLGLYYVRSVAIQRYFLVIGGTFTALIGMATVFLLYEQNKKLDVQTEQIKLQSQANAVASLLMEGTRRAALSAEQTALFADIRAEAKAIRENDGGKVIRKCEVSPLEELPRHLRSCWREVELPEKRRIELVHVSEDLLQRIRAYSLRATPYPIATKRANRTDEIDVKKPLDEQFTFPELSPERGQLLQTLVLNRVDVYGIVFEDADLNSLDLSRAYLSGAKLRGAKLSAADLRWANLSWADVSVADISRAKLDGARLFEANIAGASLVGASLENANLSGAILFRTDLSEARLYRADLSDARLNWTNLRKASLISSNLTDALLFNADLSEAKFIGAGLRRANLENIMGLPNINDGRKQALDVWLRSLLDLSIGLNDAKLPKGLTVSCSSQTEVGILGDFCMDKYGWTITYVDQPEFAPKAGGAPTGN